jgi:hypothetical protein
MPPKPKSATSGKKAVAAVAGKKQTGKAAASPAKTVTRAKPAPKVARKTAAQQKAEAEADAGSSDTDSDDTGSGSGDSTDGSDDSDDSGDDSEEGIECDPTIDVDGTSLRFSMMASPRAMDAAFGDGEKDDDSKTCLEWHFRDTAGNAWAVYDWKNLYFMKRDKILASKEPLAFNVGGRADADKAEFVAYLKENVPSATIYD